MFNRNNIYAVSIFAFLVFAAFFTSACETAQVNEKKETEIIRNQNSPTAVESQNPQNQANSIETAENVPTDLCRNKYYPVAQGNTRRYKIFSARGEVDEYLYKQDYTPGSNAFTENQDLKIGKVAALSVDWNCLPDGLRTATFAQLSGIQRIGMKLDSKGGSGITLPKEDEWQTGKKWTSEYNLSGMFEMAPIKGKVDGKIILNHEITAMDEPISVSAGNFKAAKVVTNISMNISFQGKTLPPEKLVMTNWYAPETGLVKQEVAGTLGNTRMDYLGK